ncbi:PLD nuclease N-terminal domain-containing protein [Microbacterium dauci]|uniref:PLD nuclease N-terminal domain-containing protein n=1 Tax=Microbacterium dauci TaxID=3048008 RepID=A0ABT6ZAV3_9MICO|nr:PLD nuclease N-terminal domain-containing protein [Microbacterium sp. LX3-4]MDJ1113286.1 PLD nuclease N-terminal domain-containing protein [Microbacterium sp. LX3-4]
MPYAVSLLVLAGMIFALVDIIIRDQSQVKHLPKVAWVFLVVLLPFLGTVLWFAIGREYAARRAPRPSAFAPWASEPAAPSPRDARSTEQQLADLEREIEEDRLRSEIARRRAADEQA